MLDPLRTHACALIDCNDIALFYCLTSANCAGKIATETTLLHMEDFKIPEYLGRFAVKAGMWGFVRKMSPYLKTFVKERRARGVRPNDSDPAAFGAPQVEGVVAATHTVAEQGGKQKGFGRVAVTVVAGAVLFILMQRRREQGRGGGKKEEKRARGARRV